MKSIFAITCLFSVTFGAPYSFVHVNSPYSHYSYSSGSHPKTGNTNSKIRIKKAKNYLQLESTYFNCSNPCGLCKNAFVIVQGG